MLEFIRNENDSNIQMAVFSHANGYQVQIIEGIELWLDIVVETADKVQKLAKAYGFELMAITVKCDEFNSYTRFEDQSIAC